MENQQEVWDNVANKWNQFRKEPMPEVEEFLKGKWGKILDVGCGSGRHFQCVEGELYGIDFSQKMIVLAEKKATQLGIKANLEQSEADELKFPDDFFDSIICINSLHCIETPDKRKKSIEEMFRVLKSGGDAMITVWSKTQKRINGKIGDLLVPWTVDGNKLQRYYYIYEKDELERLLLEAGFKILFSEEKDNILFEVKKP
jgi:ubiquinone/menaquinone biosynthesis C-methylase UbiE